MNSAIYPGHPDLPMTTRAVDDMPRRRWTVAEIEAMVQAGVIDEDERFELIGRGCGADVAQRAASTRVTRLHS